MRAAPDDGERIVRADEAARASPNRTPPCGPLRSLTPASGDHEHLEAQATALRWIVGLLETRAIPFQVVGGLAAHAYGATRPLVDLDFYVPTARLPEIAAVAEADPAVHLVRLPTPYRDAAWDLRYLALEVAGQRIELGGADEARYFDRRAGDWRDAAIGFARSVPRSVLGQLVPVMPREELVAYKRALDREVDRLDLAELEGADGAELT
jgi:hypothetical protein